MSDPEIPDEALVELGLVVIEAARAELWLSVAAGLGEGKRGRSSDAIKELKKLAKHDADYANDASQLADIADEAFKQRHALVHGVWGADGQTYVSLKPDTSEQAQRVGFIRAEFDIAGLRQLASLFRQIQYLALKFREDEIKPPESED